MAGHASPDQLRYELDTMLSRINAMEVTAKDEFQVSVVKILRELVLGQIRALDEFGHHKKAMDLLTLEIFKARSASAGGQEPGAS
ncbi:MAG: hypothetical protein J4G04_06600 [Nitrosopumilaceae archaeon]|nr:hypothetical protein [Nitrosopumilaceae archaeon]